MHFSRLVVLVALVGFGGGLLSSAAQAEGLAQDEAAFFRQSKYGYCDAKLIAGLWGGSVGEAKATIGYKLANGFEPVLMQTLAQARAQALSRFEVRTLRCTYSELGYSFEDVGKLSQLWGQDTGDVKLRMERTYLTEGSRQTIDAELARARQLPAPAVTDPLEAFFQSSYGYCDAAAVASYWGQSVSEAKASIGAKILHGGGAHVPALLADARSHARQVGNIPYCSY